MCPLCILFVCQCARKGDGRGNNLELACCEFEISLLSRVLFDATLHSVSLLFQQKDVQSTQKKFKENHITSNSDIVVILFFCNVCAPFWPTKALKWMGLVQSPMPMSIFFQSLSEIWPTAHQIKHFSVTLWQTEALQLQDRDQNSDVLHTDTRKN